MTTRKRAPRSGAVSVADWVAAAREVLVEQGIAAVKVEPLARKMGVTAGSFYWHFKNRHSLHRELLRDWLRSNVAPFTTFFDMAEEAPRDQFLALTHVWLFSPDFDPAFDVAIREWSKTSKLVARLIRMVDDQRIGLYQEVFEGFGYDEIPAFIRARTQYFHQIGYYTLKVEEDFDDRLRLVPYYTEVLTGDPWMLDCKTAEDVRSTVEGFRRREGAAVEVARRHRRQNLARLKKLQSD